MERHLFGVGSATRKINGERVLLLGWGRAIVLQLAHPLVAGAIADHSQFRVGRLQRLHRTLDAMLTLTYGTTQDVERISHAINAAHQRVQGRLDQKAGAFPLGTGYSARDPELLRWVHATLLDSFVLTYEQYIGRLTIQDKDRYCAEASRIGPLLGIPRDHLPTNFGELQTYMESMFGSGRITVTETARKLVRDILAPTTLSADRPLAWLMRLPTIGALPPSIRDAYGFPWSSRQEATFSHSTDFVRSLLPLMPSVLRRWPMARSMRRS